MTKEGRCVFCGKVRTEPGGACKYRAEGHATMALPEGVTCGQCRNFFWCAGVIGRSAADDSCHFWPIKFVPKLKAVAQEVPE